MNYIAQVELWAKEGGILGLIIFSLFGLVVYSIRQLVKSKKESEQFFGKLNDDAKEDRMVAREERISLCQEHNVTYNRLSDSLDALTDQLRNRD